MCASPLSIISRPILHATSMPQFAAELFEGWVSRVPIEPLTEREPEITRGHAYQIQEHVIKRRLALGDRIVGKKIGLTSRVVQRSLGGSEAVFGQLLARMVATDSRSAATML